MKIIVILLCFFFNITILQAGTDEPVVSNRTEATGAAYNQNIVKEEGLSHSNMTGPTTVVCKNKITNIIKDERPFNNVEESIDSFMNMSSSKLDVMINYQNKQLLMKKAEAKAHLFIFSLLVLLYLLGEVIFRNADAPTFLLGIRVIGVISFILFAYYLAFFIPLS